MLTIQVYRLQPQNNLPPKWHWSVIENRQGKEPRVVTFGQADTKEKALTCVQECIKSLKTETH